MSQEIDNQGDEENNTAPAEVIEIPWEEVKEVVDTRRTLLETQQHLSQLMLEHEKRKRSLLSHMEAMERELYTAVTAIQQNHSVSTEWTYEFKLPAQEGEKAYFIRKDDS